MRFKNICILAGILIVSSLALTACQQSKTQPAPADQQVFRRMESDTIQSMDPSKSTDTISRQVLIDTMDGFYRYDGQHLKPAIAKKIANPTNDGKTYTIQLRHHAKWANGTAVTAQDFVYSWQRAVDPKTNASYAYLFESVLNTNAILAGEKPVDTLGIKALDRYTIQIKLTEAVPYFNSLMTNPAFFPQNEKYIAKVGANYGTQAKYVLSNGPFILKQWTGHDKQWVEVKNKNYWDHKNVKLKKIVVNIIKDPNIALNLYQKQKLNDIVLTGQSAQRTKNDPAFIRRERARTFYTEMNQADGSAFQNQKIREALSLTINRKEVASRILGDGSLAAHSIVPQGLMTDPKTHEDFAEVASETAKTYTTYNPKRGQRLFNEGLQETNRQNLEVTLLTENSASGIAIGNYLKRTWEKNLPNLTVHVENVTLKTKLERSEAKDFDLVLSSWTADYPDVISFLDLFTTDNSYNNGSWSNEEYDRLIDASATNDALNKTARWQDLMNAQQILTQQQGVIPIYQSVEAHLVDPNVKNLKYSPANTYNYIPTYLIESERE